MHKKNLEFRYALLTDLYQITMAYCYWKEGLHEKNGVFYYFFRRSPFQGEYAVSAGLSTLIDFIEEFRFELEDIAYLRTLKDSLGKILFPEEFLTYLHNFRFHLDMDGVEEGTLVFPQEPIIRVKGSLLEGQLLETPLLNIMNFQTLIATKASRVCKAAAPGEVIEFGVRRAQGMNGALLASKAAFIGGCTATSNLLAGKEFGIPVRGTQAHSWIMSFDSEEEAFDSFAKHMKNNAFFLIDTYDSIEGVKHAIEISKKEKIKLLGVRLDSGDLAKLSTMVRKILDESGCKETRIMASNDLDEYIIQDLKRQGCKIDIWGVGSSLVTGKGEGALNGVYKLSMIQNKNGELLPKMKISEDLSKATIPGILNIYRFSLKGEKIGDLVFDEVNPPSLSEFPPCDEKKELLIPLFRSGKRTYQVPSLEMTQKRVKEELSSFDPATLRFLHPTPYQVTLSKAIDHKREEIIKKRRPS